MTRTMGDSTTLTAIAPACRCGHDRACHEHYRPGSDCGLCSCLRLRRRWRWRWAGGR